MTIELDKKDIEGNKVLFSDTTTGDPVATAEKIGAYTYKNIKWHPVMQQLYPGQTSSLTYKGFGHSSKQYDENDIHQKIGDKYEEMINDVDMPDPVKTKFDSTNFTDHGDAFNNYHIFDKNDKHVASIHIPFNMDGVPENGHSSNLESKLEFHDRQVSDHTMNLVRKKFPGNHPIKLLMQAKHIIDHPDYNPAFVGKHTSISGGIGHKAFTTSLSTEEASKKYEHHIKTSSEYNSISNFKRHSPTLFTFDHGTTADEDDDNTHMVDSSEKGMLIHHIMNKAQPIHYNNRDNEQIID